MEIPAKVSVSSEKIKTTIGLLSIILSSTGIVYNKIYLGQFGIDVANYFTVQDYLASSINVEKGDVVENMHFAFEWFLVEESHASSSQIRRSWNPALCVDCAVWQL